MKKLLLACLTLTLLLSACTLGSRYTEQELADLWTPLVEAEYVMIYSVAGLQESAQQFQIGQISSAEMTFTLQFYSLVADTVESQLLSWSPQEEVLLDHKAALQAEVDDLQAVLGSWSGGGISTPMAQSYLKDIQESLETLAKDMVWDAVKMGMTRTTVALIRENAQQDYEQLKAQYGF